MPGGEAVFHAEDDDAAHQVLGPVRPSAAMFPFGPGSAAVDRAAEHFYGDVGDEREDLLPVPPHLLLSGEPPRRVRWGLVPVTGVEAGDERLQVVRVGSA